MKDKIDRTPHPQLLNRHAYSMVNDPHLSLKAKGLWLYMHMKPDDWDFAAKRIAWETKDSVSAIYSGWKELKHLGYLKSWKLMDRREVYRLYEKRDAPEAPFLGDYDFEASGECSPWRDDCWSILDSRQPDACCNVEKLANHLIFAHDLTDADAWHEAKEWSKACTEGKLAHTWRNAEVWIKRVIWKYSETHTAKTAVISI